MKCEKLIPFMMMTLLFSACSSVSTDSTGYEVVHGWPNLPGNFELGQIGGVEVDAHGHVWVFHRAGRAFLTEPATEPIDYQTILCLDSQTGEIIRSFGADMFMVPHGLTVDQENNVWVTDVNLHQVFKFTHEGELLMTLGEKGVPGLDDEHFNGPADIAVAANGDIFIADGYGNSRIIKFAADGSYLTEWGEMGTDPGQFNLPHGIALDAQNRVYVADRSNARIQVFDSDGTSLAVWKSDEIGRPWGMDVSPDGFLYVVDGGDMEEAVVQRSHFMKLNLDGKVLGTWGSYGKYDGQFIWAHDISVAQDNAVYVGDVYWGMRVQKFVK